MSIETFDMLSVVLFVILAMILFYQSWMNLIKVQITKFSLDALLLLYLQIFRGKKSAKSSRELLSKDPHKLRMLGIFSLCGAITACYVAFDLYNKYIR
jgi:hypothetical protein